MAQDNAPAVVAAAVLQLGTVADVGKIYDHVPGWRNAEDMDEALVQVGTDDTDRQHRFWWVEDRTVTDGATFDSDFVRHELTLTGWVAAQGEEDNFAASWAAARALRSAVIAAFRDAATAFPSIGGFPMFYPEEGLPEEVQPIEFRELLGHLFHVIQVRCAPEEEVDIA